MPDPADDPATDAAHDASDPVAAWRTTMERVCDLVTSAGDQRMAAPVPATPAWTCRDLLSHMVGLGASVLRGDEPEDHHATWTEQHVVDRSDRDVATLVAEWRGLADDLMAVMREDGPRPLGDVVIHEHDLRGALGEPGAHDTAALRHVRTSVAGRVDARLAELPPLLLDGGDWRWTSRGADARDAAVVVAAPAFDLFRTLVSRRTADQVRGWTVRGDVAPYLEAFAWLGALPPAPLPPE